MTVKVAGIDVVSQNNSTVIGSVSGSTIKTNATSGGMNLPVGIMLVAQNNSLVTLDDDSTGSKNLFCNLSSSAIPMSMILETISQNGSTINGTFDVTNTTNGDNTTIGTCL